MYLMLEILDSKHTNDGLCPCLFMDHDYDTRCNISKEDCGGNLRYRPSNCPLVEVEDDR